MAEHERLVIDHVGHHGDGVAMSGGGNIYVPYTLGGETVEVVAFPGHHPDRRRLLKVPHHINDPAFAQAVVEQFMAIRG